MNLSVALITYNAERHLPAVLNAVKDIADEIVIVDNYSTDDTVKIAKSFHAHVYPEKWKGYGIQKNSAIDKCRGNWILMLDADEEVTLPLKKAIQEIISAPSPYAVYQIRFSSICFGKKILHGGWNNFYRIRLFRNRAGHFDSKPVHETFLTPFPTGRIKEYINHYTYVNLEEYFRKFNIYTSAWASQYCKEGKSKSVFSIYLSSLFAFLKMYILKMGFLDGYEGFLLAVFHALYTLVKYSKWREMHL
ncbi:MAG: glycosyltransferase family 2 protein [Tannerella sp.]|jgi:glycosyltransferase involved in cell wall biosynthesis|nr:glycosyltransferase family 2 protein [Tannerella sp.]